MCFHDCLDNGKTDAAASVFPGSCLIHLIELSPEIIQILLGYMLPCVKYRDAYLVPFPEYADSNLPLPVQVIHGIVQVVGDDLLYLDRKSVV